MFASSNNNANIPVELPLPKTKVERPASLDLIDTTPEAEKLNWAFSVWQMADRKNADLHLWYMNKFYSEFLPALYNDQVARDSKPPVPPPAYEVWEFSDGSVDLLQVGPRVCEPPQFTPPRFQASVNIFGR